MHIYGICSLFGPRPPTLDITERTKKGNGTSMRIMIMGRWSVSYDWRRAIPWLGSSAVGSQERRRGKARLAPQKVDGFACMFARKAVAVLVVRARF